MFARAQRSLLERSLMERLLERSLMERLLERSLERLL